MILGRQDGRRDDSHSPFPFRALWADHVIPHGRGRDNVENLQLIYVHSNRGNGHRPQECLIARLRKLSFAEKTDISADPWVKIENRLQTLLGRLSGV